MNRKERRKNGIRTKTYVLTEEQIKKIKNESIDTALKLMLSLPMMVVRDDFGKIIKKENRMETFMDLVLEKYTDWNDGKIKLDEMLETLKESGVTIKE